jgi:oxygen-independent coproporphyrinogen III oxidase
MTSASPVSLSELLRRYDRPGPRYTSYPTAVEFNASFGDAEYREHLALASASGGDPLSLYVHLPFCEQRCTCCGRTVIITQKREVAVRYIDYLDRELEMLAAALGDRRRLVQHHWGGGTPTYLSLEQIERLHQAVTRRFDVDVNAEQAIEIDPRVTSRPQLDLLRRLGFNRLSMGVQDFTPEVQAAINRRQRAAGFESINIDLVYGLPRQQRATFEQSLRTVVDMRPDRVAVYSYAHVPWLRPHQRAINAADLPDRDLKFELLDTAIECFLRAGYEPIGLDHFALPGDELAVAAHQRRLHRNFMGYTTRLAADMVGVGASAIGDVRGAFAQNEKTLSRYYAALDAGRFPIERGYLLSADDAVRRHVITELMCNGHVSRASVSERFAIDFDSYFASELQLLQEPGGPISDGFLTVGDDGLTTTIEGRPFIRNICMAFDAYLPSHGDRPVFSRTV